MPAVKIKDEVIDLTKDQLDLLRKSFNGNKKSVEINDRIIDPKEITNWKVKPAISELPTKCIILDENRNIIDLSEHKLRGTKYILCKAHYKTEYNGEESYLIDDDSKIPEMLFMIPDDQPQYYPNKITKILRYGEEQTNPELKNRW
jgi:hypothetical protein